MKVSQFNENTGKELEDKLKKLADEKQMKGLVLDLRENPGGLLNEGVDVASHFLKKGDLVVSFITAAVRRTRTLRGADRWSGQGLSHCGSSESLHRIGCRNRHVGKRCRIMIAAGFWVRTDVPRGRAWFRPYFR